MSTFFERLAEIGHSISEAAKALWEIFQDFKFDDRDDYWDH